MRIDQGGHGGDVEQGDVSGEFVLLTAEVFFLLADELGILDLFLAEFFDFRFLGGREGELGAAGFLGLEVAEFLLGGFLLLLELLDLGSDRLVEIGLHFLHHGEGAADGGARPGTDQVLGADGLVENVEEHGGIAIGQSGHLLAGEVLDVVGEAVVERIDIGDEEDVAGGDAFLEGGGLGFFFRRVLGIRILGFFAGGFWFSVGEGGFESAGQMGDQVVGGAVRLEGTGECGIKLRGPHGIHETGLGGGFDEGFRSDSAAAGLGEGTG